MDDRERVNAARKNITREEWKSAKTRAAGLSILELNELLITEDDPQMREHYSSLIKNLKDIEADRALQKIEEQKREERIKRKALVLGPTLSKRLWWKMCDAVNFSGSALKWCANAVVYAFTSLGQLFFNYSYGVLPVLVIAGFVLSMMFDRAYDIGNALGIHLLSIIASTVAACLSIILINDANYEYEKNAPRSLATIFSLLLTLSFFLTLGWKCPTPNAQYVGVCTENGKITRVIDCAHENWMDSPRWWNHEQISWYNLLTEARDKEFVDVHNNNVHCRNKITYGNNNFNYEEILKENWARNITFSGGKGIVTITAKRKVNIEGFKTLHLSGKTVDWYEQDLREKAKSAIDRYVNSPTHDLEKLLEELRDNAKNDIFSLKNIEGVASLSEKRTAATDEKKDN